VIRVPTRPGAGSCTLRFPSGTEGRKTVGLTSKETPTMKPTEMKDDLLAIIREVAMTTGGSSAEIKAALEAKLGVGGLQALELLSSYAQGEMDDDETASEAEMQAVALSRQLVRPLLEKRMQHQIDKVDKATAKKKQRRAPAAK